MAFALFQGCGTDENTSSDDVSDTMTDSSNTDADGDAAEVAEPYQPPSPDAWLPKSGSGIPATSFEEDELFEPCAYIDVGELSPDDHYNLATVYDGYMMLPVSPEYGGGGLTFWDISDPCAPSTIGETASETMRETHAMGFTWMDGQAITASAYLKSVIPEVDPDTGAITSPGGIQLWDITDPTAPSVITDADVPNHFYPDAYARVVLSTSMQGPYLFVGQTDVGVHAFDISDPTQPELVGSYQFDPILRVGQVQAIGNLLIVSGAETPDTALLDITDPTDMKLLPGGRFQTEDEEGEVRAFYFSNMIGGFVYYARKESGGGLMVYDIRDPLNPTFAGAYGSDGNGGYVFVHEDRAFVGESRYGSLYDISDFDNIAPLGEFELEGDLDTVTPLGHLAFVSVDENAADDQGGAIVPWTTEADENPPEARWSQPLNEATDFPLNGRIGVTFNEWVEPMSAFEGSVRLLNTDTGEYVRGIISVQETIINFAPHEPLEANTSYQLELPSGGITDLSGNTMEESFTVEFTTTSAP